MKWFRPPVWTPLCFAIVSGCICARIAHGAGAVPDKVRAAYSSPSPTQGVLWVAQLGGLFLRNGLSVEIIFTRAAIETLVAGEVEFAQMTGALMSSAKL
jgi:ABC-type nitrate/sulfonate/bicarbonate transport system substrate-binding protein